MFEPDINSLLHSCIIAVLQTDYTRNPIALVLQVFDFLHFKNYNSERFNSIPHSISRHSHATRMQPFFIVVEYIKKFGKNRGCLWVWDLWGFLELCRTVGKF